MSNTKKYNKQFHISYVPGWLGTWLFLLVNKHHNFPQYHYDIIVNNGLKTDYGTASGLWLIEDRQTLAESCNILAEYDSENLSNATKRGYKTFPEHLFCDDNNNVDILINAVRSEDVEYNVIFANLTDEDHLRRAALRFKGITNNDECNNFEDLFNYYKHTSQIINRDKTFAPSIEKFANSFIYIDVGKLLFNKDQNEYIKLCEFINEEPLENWTTFCDEALENVWVNYV